MDVIPGTDALGAIIDGMPPREATTYTTSYEPAPFGSDSPLEMVTLKSGEHEIAVIPVKLLREMIAELRPILNSENNELIDKVRRWGEEKGITGPGGKGTIEAQAKKFAEESAELLIEVGKDLCLGEMLTEAHEDAGLEDFVTASSETKDAIGDTLVTLILLCDLYGITLEDCLQQAYDVIAKRTGKMINGQFVKDN